MVLLREKGWRAGGPFLVYLEIHQKIKHENVQSSVENKVRNIDTRCMTTAVEMYEESTLL